MIFHDREQWKGTPTLVIISQIRGGEWSSTLLSKPNTVRFVLMSLVEVVAMRHKYFRSSRADVYDLAS